MRLFLCLIIFYSNQTYGYTIGDLNISENEFHRYVKPQLINITQDYYSLLTSINPENKHLRPFVNLFKELKTNLDGLTKICQKDRNPTCLTLIAKTNDLINKGALFFNTQPSYVEKDNFTPNDLLISFDHSFQFQHFYKNLQFEFANQYFFYTIDMPLSKAFFDFRKDAEFCENLFNIYLIKSSDGQFRSEFLSFWSEFIRPVHNMILPNGDFSLFIRKLNDFNLRLNFLNVALTKRNKQINTQANSLLKTIHNRWNTILKTTLRR